MLLNEKWTRLMKVILNENIEKLGKMGDVVTVKDGYGRNYLIPKKRARLATPGNLKAIEALKKKLELEREKKKQDVLSLAERLGSTSCTISMPSGEEDKLHGTVTPEMIAEALKVEGFSVERKDVTLEEPIKKLGVYQVVVKVHPEIKTNLKVWVVKE